MSRSPHPSVANPVTDTIAAIATAPGPAGVGIIRVSGPSAAQIAQRLIGSANKPLQQPGHTLRYVLIHDPESGENLDSSLLAVFWGPRSFTGEDVVEFHLHGGPVTLSRVLTAVFAAGARPARPGEFTERAFLNGKLDLAQAEAIADLINAGTVAAQRAARRQLSGELSCAVGVIKGHIAEALARIEASIDYPEEIGEIDPETVDASLERAERSVRELLATASYGQRLRDGMTVVLTGRPNVGKSSLLNALAGSERAIVTPIPGTTRDVVEEALNLGGIPVRALDTAGLRETEDVVERIGVERAERAASEADVVIAVLDATGLTNDDHKLLTRLESGPPVVVAVNKADSTDPSSVLAELVNRFPAVATSAVTRAGLEELASRVAEAVGGAATGADTPLVTAARQEAALRAAGEGIARARATVAAGLPAELIAVDAHGAIGALGEITGETTREDIIAEVFSRFCLGK